MVPCAAFGCNNKSSNPGVEGSGKMHSFRSSDFIEEVDDQTGLELFSMSRQLSTLSHVASSFT